MVKVLQPSAGYMPAHQKARWLPDILAGGIP